MPTVEALPSTATSPRVSALSRVCKAALRCFGFALAMTYLIWNAWWLVHQQAPPALIKAFTGLPAPTTGLTRSLQALFAGDLTLSLAYNPMTLPIFALLGVTVFRVVTRRRVGPGYAWAWAGLLAAAWLIKLASPAWTW